MIVKLLSTSSSILMSLIGITSIIVFHEFGHFIFCKLFGVYTPTFSIGIGKKLYSKMIGDTEFCISAGPLGGYVEIASDDSKGKKGFNSISYWKKFLIILGGIGFNMIFAYMIFTALFYVGMPDSAFMPYENSKPTISQVNANSINYQTLQANDTIISINNEPINNRSEIIKQEVNKRIFEHKTTIPATISRNNRQQTIIIQLSTDQQPLTLEKRLDVALERKAPLSIGESVTLGISITHFYIKAIFNSLTTMVSTKNTKGLVGPIMAVAASTKGAEKGLKYLLIFLAIISINLGIMNLIPLPIFDGGQFVIFTIEAILQRELSVKVKDAIGKFSWTLILSLFVIFTIKDIYTLIMG